MLEFPRHGDGINLDLAELLARQSQHKLIKLAAKSRQHATLSGNRLSHIKGRGMEFSEVRAYQAGDDVRTIDWRITARTGKAHTKLFSEERERPVLFCVDLGLGMRVGSQLLLQSVQAAHLTALLGWHFMTQGDRIGGLVHGQVARHEYKPKGRRAGLLPLLNGLVDSHRMSVVNAAHLDWLQSLSHLHHLAKPGTLAIVITNTFGLDPAAIKRLAQLKRHAEVRVFCITDPLFEHPQLPKQLAIQLQGHQQQEIWLDAKQQQLWRDDWFARQQQSQQLLHQHQMTHSVISAAEPLEQQWQQLWL